MTASTAATLRTMVAIPATSMLEIRLDAMNHFWRQPGGSVDLDQSPAPAGTFRRHRYRAATRHRALPGPNSPAGSSRRATTVAGRQSRQKFANEDHRSHAGSRDRIAIHALKCGRERLPAGLPSASSLGVVPWWCDPRRNLA